jgi:hypothetical protein
LFLLPRAGFEVERQFPGRDEDVFFVPVAETSENIPPGPGVLRRSTCGSVIPHERIAVAQRELLAGFDDPNGANFYPRTFDVGKVHHEIAVVVGAVVGLVEVRRDAALKGAEATDSWVYHRVIVEKHVSLSFCWPWVIQGVRRGRDF